VPISLCERRPAKGLISGLAKIHHRAQPTPGGMRRGRTDITDARRDGTGKKNGTRIKEKCARWRVSYDAEDK